MSHAHGDHAHSHVHQHGGLWDRLGVLASFACLIHCLALPLLLPLLPALALVPHGGVHIALLLPIVGLSLLAIVPGYRCHGLLRVVVLAGIGVTLCTAAVVAETAFGIESLDVPLTAAGGLMLVSAHLINLHHTRRHKAAASCAA